MAEKGCETRSKILASDVTVWAKKGKQFIASKHHEMEGTVKSLGVLDLALLMVVPGLKHSAVKFHGQGDNIILEPYSPSILPSGSAMVKSVTFIFEGICKVPCSMP